MATATIERLEYLKGAGIFADVRTGSFPHHFKRYNLIYGFNGSGKTTISRLLNSISDEGMNDNLSDGVQFCFILSDGTRPSHDNTKSPTSRFIAVFNEDYVERSLTWKQGSAKPIVYLGKEQADLGRDLARAEIQLADINSKVTLHSSEWSSASKGLETFCRDAARLIAEETNSGRKYNASDLKSDFEHEDLSPSLKLSDERKLVLKEIISKTSIPEKIQKIYQIPGGDLLYEEVQSAIDARVERLAIESLQRRKDALSWVEAGIDLHTGEGECLFCGGALSDQRLASLKSALSAGFESLASMLDRAIVNIDEFVTECNETTQSLSRIGEVLPGYKTIINEQANVITARLTSGIAVAEEWRKALQQKKANPDLATILPKLPGDSWDRELSHEMKNLSHNIQENNDTIDNFSKEQTDARNAIRLHYLADAKSGFESASALEREARSRLDKSCVNLADIEGEIRLLRDRMSSHGPAADEINKLISSYLGHNSITIQAVDEGFKIYRKKKEAKKPLSEGEKTAVAFCYFLTALKAEGRDPSDLIVILDDPISSLDARAMTHVSSLIQRQLENVVQLFVLTHNLDFMREMKKWMGSKRLEESSLFLFVETGIIGGERSSNIVVMPKLIREYESEYHYLYSLVKSLAGSPAESEKFSYLMPNAIRKVLDIFLAFKIPGGMGLGAKIDKLLTDYSSLDPARVRAMERLAQLESHSESIGDTTTFSAYTLEQVADAARCLLEIINTVDAGHYSAMDRLCRP